jgi:hypothetical protein
MYEINGSAINASPINGVGVAPIATITGAGALISIEQSITRTESGKLFNIEQLVGIIGSGSLFNIEQSVYLRSVGAGSLISIEQSISNFASGRLFNIEQRVHDATVYSNTDKYGFDAYLYIGGAAVPANQIHDSIAINRSENSAALMDVTLITPTGTQDVQQWHGKTITLDIETATGITRVYTGVVDIPEFDLIKKTVTLRCTDRRTEQINEQLASELPFIGSWSDALFNKPEDVFEELTQRLTTPTKTVDFDAYGNYTIADYLPKATADYTLSDASIYRRSPSVQIASRGRLINRVNVEFEYRYTRLRHRQRNFQLIGASFCEVINHVDLSFLSTDSVKTNLESFGWNVNLPAVSFEYLPGGGVYNCGGGKFFWSPIVTSGTTATVKDSDGNVVYDSNDNPKTEVINRTVTDYTQAFCLSASWAASKRFAQDISEKVNLTISAPQSVTQYGLIEQSQRNGKDIDYDATEYEDDISYAVPDGFIATAGDSYQDKSGTAAGYRAALRTSFDIAITKITKSHRDNHVTVETPIWPEIDLSNTIETTAGIIQARGKVTQISHTIDINNRFAETVTQFSLSRAVGSQSDTPLTIPILNASLIGGYETNTLKMYSYDNGSIGFGTNSAKAVGMVTPAIDDESRNRQISESSYTLDIAIRNDPLTVVF